MTRWRGRDPRRSSRPPPREPWPARRCSRGEQSVWRTYVRGRCQHGGQSAQLNLMPPLAKLATFIRWAKGVSRVGRHVDLHFVLRAGLLDRCRARSGSGCRLRSWRRMRGSRPPGTMGDRTVGDVMPTSEKLSSRPVQTGAVSSPASRATTPAAAARKEGRDICGSWGSERFSPGRLSIIAPGKRLGPVDDLLAQRRQADRSA